MSKTRPKFDPWPCYLGAGADVLPSLGNEWTPLVSCPANFPPELFGSAVSLLLHHPEYNSTLILRSDIIHETSVVSEFPKLVPTLVGHEFVQCLTRRLLPRRPERDASVDQHCTLYSTGSSQLLKNGTGNAVVGHSEQKNVTDTLVLTPVVPPGSTLPYYHPAVYHFAFRYLRVPEPTEEVVGSSTSDPIDSGSYVHNRLRIEVQPLPGTPSDPQSRLYRTSLALLDALHRYGWGMLNSYQKRVFHDVHVPREAYQDLYLVLRARHRGLVDTWKESTDPLKHVFEDISIATYLMLLWKTMFASDDLERDRRDEDLQEEPWRWWPRPPAGFIDLGCGNGLLTHILITEGYNGHGLDLRSRTSWSSYPTMTQASLHVCALDPAEFVIGNHVNVSFTTAETHIPAQAFLIGNHADELTPWVPVLATACNASGFLNIPCCAWAFDERWQRGRLCLDEFASRLNLGAEGCHTSGYAQYRIWLAALTAYCGWCVECEALRIPSTRNWALVGAWRTRSKDAGAGRVHVHEIANEVRRRGLFKTRRPEGKAGDVQS
ncbi:DUF1613-domain-containing protein [Fistulina hepatica ATCC 64428]|uniref:tRNA (uracil-O(2)-)-methyltransferase n=1 Tax=Fistulina hepatica ATCC 64428 TaxID=1128425 RepID=A0A0D7ADD9_9AGAR|nr:DUF1613-domain-containing protein [Fistulina hepatica ATCC 64428]